nr:efflux RND transporter permease subunit [Paraburkholderia kururiensis]
MWIVRLALRRPYTFVVLALLLMIVGPLTILRTPVDIFPNIDIPVLSVIWTYNGLPADEMEKRIVLNYERGLSVAVNDIEHVESTSLNGIAVVKIFFQPHANIQEALAEVTALSQTQPLPYGGKQRQIMVDIDSRKLQEHNLSPMDVVNAISAQNLILPTGTAKIGSTGYSVEMNASHATLAGLNAIPVRTTANGTVYIRIVFVPMFLLTSVAHYLFIPLAEAVVFAMLASYFFSRTLVPTLANDFFPQDEAVTAAERTLTIVSNRYAAGAITYLDAVVAQTTALTNEREAALRATAAGQTDASA